jgi:hypothetical protein
MRARLMVVVSLFIVPYAAGGTSAILARQNEWGAKFDQ